MGPITILDKSAFQALSHREHSWFSRLFLENLTPVLVLEILGDLAKTYPDNTVPADKAAELASKFLGSGRPPSVDSRRMALSALGGAELPMDGRMVPDGQVPVRTADGGLGIIIDVQPLNRLIMRLQDGDTSELDNLLATLWRTAAQNLGLTPLNDFVNHHRVIVPRATSPSEAESGAREMLDTVALQPLWLRWLLEELAPAAPLRAKIITRWRSEGIMLRSFAPYAHFRLRALLTLFVAWRNNLVNSRPTNLLDLQYLYYLPFCMVFVSDDRLHRNLAPTLTRADQTFVNMRDFKQGLRQSADFMEGLSPTERRYVDYALGGWAPPLRGSVVYDLWRKHCLPWNPTRVNRVAQRTLSPEEQAKAIEFVESLARDAEPA